MKTHDHKTGLWVDPEFATRTGWWPAYPIMTDWGPDDWAWQDCDVCGRRGRTRYVHHLVDSAGFAVNCGAECAAKLLEVPKRDVRKRERDFHYQNQKTAGDTCHCRICDPIRNRELRREAWERANACNSAGGTFESEDTIGVANEMQAKRVLIICPAIVRGQWAELIRERSAMPELWTQVGAGVRIPALNRISLIVSARHGVDPTAPWTIVSYDLVAKPGILEALIASPKFDLLIVDGLNPWSPKTKRTHAVFGGSPSLLDRCGKVVATHAYREREYAEEQLRQAQERRRQTPAYRERERQRREQDEF